MNSKDELERAITVLTTLQVTIEQMRDQHRGNNAGRYLSMAITEIETARHWLDDAAYEIASIDSMIPGGQYKD